MAAQGCGRGSLGCHVVDSRAQMSLRPRKKPPRDHLTEGVRMPKYGSKQTNHVELSKLELGRCGDGNDCFVVNCAPILMSKLFPHKVNVKNGKGRKCCVLWW